MNEVKKSKAELENQRMATDTITSPFFKRACENFVDACERYVDLDELPSKKTYAPYGDTSVCASDDVCEEALEEAKKEKAIYFLQDGIDQYHQFKFFVSCLNDDIDCEEYIKEMTANAILIIEEL